MRRYLSSIPAMVCAILLVGCKPSKLTKSSDSNLSYKSPVDDSTLYALKSPFIMPYNRVIEGAGQSVAFGEGTMENHSLDAVLLLDQETLVVEDRFGIAFFDITTRKLIDRWSFAKDSKFKSSMSTFSGITSIVHNDSTFIFWGAGGRDIFLGAGNNEKTPNSFVAQAYWDRKHAKLIRTFPFEAESPATIALPNQVVAREENGELFFYTVLNGNNRLVKVRVRDQKIIWSSPTGVAPFGISIVGEKAWVTNWAGPVPDPTNGLETAGIPWGSAYVDPKTGAMVRGTVSIININSGNPEKEISVGLHPNAIISSPDKKSIYVANGNSDYVSVISTVKEEVTDSIFVGLFKRETEYIGSTPNALAINGEGNKLYVANGLDNAICVVDITTKPSVKNYSVQGYIPTEAYPSGIVINKNELYVTNLEATGARAANSSASDIFGIEKMKEDKEDEKKVMAFNTHKQLASISFIPIPTEGELKAYTEKVRKLNMEFRLALSERLPRKDIAPRPVPERIGEPSVFKHVLYIIKENRTYDQVFGDMPEGRGMPSLCIFGDSITPNQHKLAREYLLMDNYHVSGKGSAEGHHWASAAMVTDYTEKSVRAWFRSYPHVLYDAMVYNKKGLIWNNALDHGKTVRIYGEACSFEYDEKLYNWKKLYDMREAGTIAQFKFKNTTTISRLRPVLSQTFPGGADETVSDQMRADAFIKELNEISAQSGDQLPNLMIMALPNDHTAGTNPNYPTPQAMVADNDLAVGRIVEAVMSSRFAESTVIFISEDDSQAGWDHISAYRTTGFVISAYSRLQKTVRTNYNQTSLVRTMEQILGLPPMNVIDATALPMFDCFTDTPNLTYKYIATKNLIPLDRMNPDPKALQGKALKFSNQSAQYGFYQIDKGRDDLLNRILWFSVKGNQAYPAHLAGPVEDDE
ncbi:MAG: bifunctional YncE family protein/alkaline phosphatase family protein [Cyclobacteriaceae bacterium]